MDRKVYYDDQWRESDCDYHTKPGIVQATFGEWKESDFGLEGEYYGLKSFLGTQYISIGISS